MNARSVTITLGASLLGALLLLALLEGAIAGLLRTAPGSGSAAFEHARKRYYMDHERQIVQFRPECAEHDPRLGYRLREGSCRFRNREFDTRLEINSLGLRDSEAALRAPEIVVLGDSFAMGWGVEQSETLSAALARISDARTLNVAVSSWGSARQLMSLQRVDLSEAHSLVIQYCENDFIENRTFELGGGRLQGMDRERYAAATAEHLDATRFFPGKYLLRFFPLWWRADEAAEAGPIRPCGLDAAAFLGVLHLAEVPPLPPGRRLRVVVFEALYGLDRPACFVDRLQRQIRRRGLPAWISQLTVIDSTTLLSEEDYFPLDEHLRASGYEKIAAAVAARLRSARPEFD